MKGVGDKASHAIARKSLSGTSECKEVALEVMSGTGRGFDCFGQCTVLQTHPAREGV